MKQLFEFFPIVLFFIAYKKYGIYIATEVMIAATAVGVALTWLKYKEVSTMQWVTLGLAIVMGGLTIYLHDERFLKWKLSIVEWLFGLVFIGSQFIGKKPFVQRMMSSYMTPPDSIWRKINLRFGIFFIAIGFLNVYVIYYHSTDDWVTFKTFIVPALFFIFMALQMVTLYKYIPETKE